MGWLEDALKKGEFLKLHEKFGYGDKKGGGERPAPAANTEGYTPDGEMGPSPVNPNYSNEFGGGEQNPRNYIGPDAYANPDGTMGEHLVPENAPPVSAFQPWWSPREGQTMGEVIAPQAGQQGGQAAQQPAAPTRDFSGAGGNPFAAKAQQMGYSDFDKQKMQAQALRGNGGY